MKKLILFTISMLFAFTISAQENSPEIWMSYELKVKKGMSEKFEQAAAKKTKKFNNTAETGMFTFNIMDGENQGMYSRVVGWKDWSYMNSQDDRSDELKYWKDNVDPFVESSTGWKVWRRLKWVSHNWKPENNFNYMLVRRRFIKPGKDQDVLNFLKRLQMVYKKNNFSGIVGIFRIMSGGNTNEFIICEGFNTYGESGKYPDTEKSEKELYNEMFGWEAYNRDAGLYNDSLEMYSRTTERQHFNEKLSTKLD
mgnify:FL=1